MDQIQCPNCGGYDIELTNKPTGMELLMALGFVFYILPGLIMMRLVRNEYSKRWQSFYDGEGTVTCKLCQFQFWIHQVPSVPIQPNQRLIQTGRQRLREEEEERKKRLRRRIYYDD